MSRAPSAAGSRGGGKSVWGVAVLLAAIAPAGFSAADGTAYGSAGLGGGYDTSVLGDSSGLGDAAYSAEALVGWRGRLPGSLRSSGEAGIFHEGFVRFGDENIERGYLALEAERNLPFDLRAGLALGAEAFIQPGYREMNAISGRVVPSVGWRPLEGTLVEVDFVPGYSLSPDYDLENRRVGVGMKIIQELGLDGEFEASWSQGTADFMERDVYADAAGSSSGVSRRDRDFGAKVSVSWEWDGLEVSAGYDWYRLASNGNLVDYGPGQAEDSNTDFTDDRLDGDFYSNTDQGPGAAVSFAAGDGILLGIAGRMRRLEFDGQIAKNADEVLDLSGPIRADTRYEVEVTADLSMISPAVRLYWARGMGSSNHYLYDFTRDRFGLKVTSSF